MKHCEYQGGVTVKQTNIIEKLKTGSKWLTIAFAAGGIGSILWAVSSLISLLTYMNHAQGAVDYEIYYYVQHAAEGVCLAAMLLTAAFMFRGISRSGIPFEEKTIRSVRTIGFLCIFQGIGSHLLATLLAQGPYFSLTDLFPMHIIAEGVLFLFAAMLMKYGALLQTEADETV